ncbi:MAG: hypothetical protein CMM28_09925 [Rhodospirillaceae bacterium]|nr:hypothetical protein [Rhodospirillaceae bacterium]|tara:strand:- start:2101 stop:2301 length:201 start_codon:yes stop_codon:yes gene_type:complete
MDDQQAIRIKIEELKVTHRDLDDAIARVAESPLFDQVTLQRLKKRKLAVRDQLGRMENKLIPDIIA